jgi:fructosamine-3-kinase
MTHQFQEFLVALVQGARFEQCLQQFALLIERESLEQLADKEMRPKQLRHGDLWQTNDVVKCCRDRIRRAKNSPTPYLSRPCRS